MKPTLLILAAGMGSRYGGLKQIDGIVNLSDYLLKEIPSILNDVVIKGTLDISDNRIRNLNNFPLECDSVDLSDNPLTSLVGIKQKRMGVLILNRTKIQNLEGCPELVSQLIIKNIAVIKTIILFFITPFITKNEYNIHEIVFITGFIKLG